MENRKPKAPMENPYYERAFQTHQAGTLFMNWNWAAFFFGAGWLAFRRAYNQCTLFTLIDTLIKISITFLPLLLEVEIVYILNFITILILHLVLGLYGTSLYGRDWSMRPVPHSDNESFISYFVWYFLASLLFGIVYAAVYLGVKLLVPGVSLELINSWWRLS